MERAVPAFTLLTQNIDSLHQRAGSVNVVELHGNIARTKCFEEDTLVESWEETGAVPPRCPRCGGPLRPDVVWFGELLPTTALEDRHHRRQAVRRVLLDRHIGDRRASRLAGLPGAGAAARRW